MSSGAVRLDDAWQAIVLEKQLYKGIILVHV